MKKTVKMTGVAFMLLALVCLCGCNKSSVGRDINSWQQRLEEEGFSKDDIVLSEDYSADLVFFDTNTLNQPQGIARMGEYFVVADRAENCLLIFDMNGKLVKTVGQTGQGSLQFVRPTGLYFDGTILYVVDSGNSRVQLLDATFKYVGEKALNKVEILTNTTPSYSHIIVDDDKNIYVSFPQAEPKYEHIYKIAAEDDKVSLIGENLTGCFAQNGKTLYYANTFEVDAKYNSVYNGANFIYTFDGDELDILFELPYGLTPQDIFIKDGCFYVLDAQLSTVDRFGMDGAYQDSIYGFDDLADDIYARDSFFFHDVQSGYIIISLPDTAQLICLKPNE